MMLLLMWVALCLCWCEDLWVVGVDKEIFILVYQIMMLSENLFSFCLTGFSSVVCCGYSSGLSCLYTILPHRYSVFSLMRQKPVRETALSCPLMKDVDCWWSFNNLIIFWYFVVLFLLIYFCFPILFLFMILFELFVINFYELDFYLFSFWFLYWF
jgi:hypothetical protein